MVNPPQNRPDAPSGFKPWELDLIRRLVEDFITERRPPNDIEFDDLYQECLTRWWSQRERYDEARGASRGTFLRRVVQGKLRDLARGWTAEKRGSGHLPLSLDAPASAYDHQGRTIGEMLSSQERLEADLASLLDLRQITSQLSERQRDIIAGVTAGMNKSDLSRHLRISRDTLYEQLRHIQRVFRDEGLAEHLR